MAGGVDQIQLVQIAIAGAVMEADGVRLDGNASLALQIHRVEHLGGHFPQRKRAGDLQHTVGQGGLAVVNVSDYREVANVTCVRNV